MVYPNGTGSSSLYFIILYILCVTKRARGKTNLIFIFGLRYFRFNFRQQHVPLSRARGCCILYWGFKFRGITLNICLWKIFIFFFKQKKRNCSCFQLNIMLENRPEYFTANNSKAFSISAYLWITSESRRNYEWIICETHSRRRGNITQIVKIAKIYI